MTLENYAKDAINFAKESKNWTDLPFGRFYTTNGNGWEETSDNCIGGIDVSWAFHLTEEEIKDRAGQEMINRISELIRLVIDDEWDGDQMEYIYRIIS